MNSSERHISVLKWCLAAAAYLWLAWQLYNYDGYDSLLTGFGAARWYNWLSLCLCLLLMPVNIHLEARRWRTLVAPLSPISGEDALKQVYGGMLGAFLTPYRAGELPARVYLLNNRKIWKEALAAGVFGGGLMTLVIVVFGIIPAFYVLAVGEMHAVWIRLAVAAACLAVIVAMAVRFRRNPGVVRTFLHILPCLTGWTVLRYLCFSAQMALMLCFTGVCLPIADMMTALPLYYMLVTLTPNMPVADAGIRGSWAVFVFSRYSDNVPMIALAAVLLWFVNTVIPVFVGLWLSNHNGVCPPDDECIVRQDAQNP